MSFVFALTVAVLVAVAIFHLMQRDAVKVVLGVSILFGAANLFLLACSAFLGADDPHGGRVDPTDPIPQVLILTSLAIGFGVTAFLISLVLAISKGFGTLDVDEVSDLEG